MCSTHPLRETGCSFAMHLWIEPEKKAAAAARREKNGVQNIRWVNICVTGDTNKNTNTEGHIIAPSARRVKTSLLAARGSREELHRCRVDLPVSAGMCDWPLSVECVEWTQGRPASAFLSAWVGLVWLVARHCCSIICFNIQCVKTNRFGRGITTSGYCYCLSELCVWIYEMKTVEASRWWFFWCIFWV